MSEDAKGYSRGHAFRDALIDLGVRRVLIANTPALKRAPEARSEEPPSSWSGPARARGGCCLGCRWRICHIAFTPDSLRGPLPDV
jgi:hypothetical protein